MCERNIHQLPLACALTGDGTHNPGMCPDGEWNWRPFALRDNAQPFELHPSGQKHDLSIVSYFCF